MPAQVYFQKAAGGSEAASYIAPLPVSAGADARNAALLQVQVTLTTANTVYTVALPTSARGFTLFPSTADVIFAVAEAPVALATSAGNTAVGAFGIGATAPFAVVTARVLNDARAAAGAVLHLRSATAAAVVVVGIF